MVVRTVLVPEQSLPRPHIVPSLPEIPGNGVADVVASDPFDESGGADRFRHRVLHQRFVDGVAPLFPLCGFHHRPGSPKGPSCWHVRVEGAAPRRSEGTTWSVVNKRGNGSEGTPERLRLSSGPERRSL